MCTTDDSYLSILCCFLRSATHLEMVPRNVDIVHLSVTVDALWWKVTPAITQNTSVLLYFGSWSLCSEPTVARA